MNSEELDKRYERMYKEAESIFPTFINQQSRELRKYPELNKQPRTKITDFRTLIVEIWKISNKEYQERFWVRQELPMRGDNFMETVMTFNEDTRAVLDTSDYAVEMTDKQRDMLKNLYDMIDIFEDDPETPEDLGYGENDEAIVNDPKWHKVREYAKLVYMELTGDKI